MFGLTRRVVAAVSVAAAVAVPATVSTAVTSPRPRAAPAGGVGLRLLDVPVDARTDPRARVYIVDHLAPGAVIHRRIEVSNTTASLVHVDLYPAAASIANGSFLGAAGHTPNDLSRWTSVVPRASDVPAGGNVDASVTIAVPRDAAAGERYAVVWCEARSAPAAGHGVIEVSRVGIRLYLSVGPGGPPAANFAIESLTAERALDGRPIVRATMRNTGGRALDMSGTLQLVDGPAELRAGPFPATLGVTVAIGATEAVMFALDARLPNGPWDARITLRSGLLEHSARANITFPDRGTALPVKVTSPRRGWPRPLVAALIVGLIGVAALFGIRYRRRSTRRSG
jgi:hypothetical protein